jgi:hypothetical protein
MKASTAVHTEKRPTKVISTGMNIITHISARPARPKRDVVSDPSMLAVGWNLPF